MTEPNNSNKSVSQLLREAETYRLMEFNNQLKAPVTPLSASEEKFNQAITILLQTNQKKQLAWAYAHLGVTKFQHALVEQELDQVTFFDQAIEAFDNAITQKPQYPWAFAHKGQTLIHKALLFLEQGDNPNPQKNPKDLLNTAIQSLQTAIDQSDKNYAWAYAQLGMAYRWLSLYAENSDSREKYLNESLNALDAAIHQNDQYVWAYAYRNVVRHIKKDYAGAWDDLMQAIELNPNITSSFRNISAGSSKTPQMISSHALTFAPSKSSWAEEKLQQEKDNPVALYLLALEKAEREGIEAAREAIEQARSAGVA